MKTKVILIISLILLLPSLVSLLINILVSYAYLHYQQSEILKFNHSFAFYCCMIGFICIAFIAEGICLLMKYSTQIDRLEEAEKKYNKMTEEMEQARDKYTELLMSNKAEQ